MIARLEQVIGGTSRSLGYIASALIIVIMVLVCLDALLRATGGGLTGSVEYSILALSAVAYLGLAETSRVQEHVKVDLFHTASPRVRDWLEAAGTVPAVAIVVWVTVLSWNSMLDSRASGEVLQGIADVAVWPARLAIAVGFGALAVQMIVDLLALALRAGRATSTEVTGQYSSTPRVRPRRQGRASLSTSERTQV